MKASVTVLLYILIGRNVVFGQVADPIRDYLSMDVADRREFLDRYSTIYRAKCDVDGDGKDEVLVGTVYEHSGNKTTYWTVYTPSGSQFNRISSATADIPIALRDAFIGPVEEEAKQGLLVVMSRSKTNYAKQRRGRRSCFSIFRRAPCDRKRFLRSTSGSLATMPSTKSIFVNAVTVDRGRLKA